MLKSLFLALFALSSLQTSNAALSVVADKVSPWQRGIEQPDAFYFMPAGIGDDYGRTADSGKIKADIQTAKAVGAKFLRFGISWLEIESEKDQYDWKSLDEIVALAAKEKIKLMPYVCYTPQWVSSEPKDEEFWNKAPRDLARFGHFMGKLAERYKASVDIWGLWNEPDIDIFWGGTPQEYAEMMRSGKKEILKKNPNATVYLGGFGNAPRGFFKKVLFDEGLNRDFQIIGIHNYPETLNDQRVEGAYPATWENVKSKLAETGAAHTLWLEETGYSNYRFSPRNVTQWGVVPAVYAYEHTEKYQAVNLWKQHILALGSRAISLVAWYRIHDLPSDHGVIGDDNNKFLGIVDVKGQPKLAFAALAFFNRLFDEPTRSLDERFKISRHNRSQAEVHLIEKQSGDVIVTAWLRSSRPKEIADQTGMATDTRPSESATVVFPKSISFKKAEWYDLNGGKLKTSDLENPTRLVLDGIKGDAVVTVILRK